MTEAFRHPEHVRLWEAARREKDVDWGAFLSPYEVAVDWPACAFYRELMEAFPRAVVILTVRDPESWYESTRSTIYGLRRILPGPAFALVGLFAPGPAGMARLANDLVWQDTFEGRFEDRHHAIETFERRNEVVRRTVPRERLLVFDVREGWGPLCDFLGVGVPNIPFPHLNDTREMRRRLLGVAAAAATPVLAFAGLAAMLVLLLRVRRRGPGAPVVER